MHKLLFQKRLYDVIVSIALISAIFGLVVFPSECVEAAKNGVELCLNVIIPSLFPFFVFSTLIVQLGLSQYLGRILEPIMRPVFGVGGACSTAFVLGFIGGYPVGAKTVISLYENGDCSKAEAERLLAFCNNSGPAFIFGVVGAGIFSSSRIGLLIYLAHSLSSVIIGVLFRRWGEGKRGKEKTAPAKRTHGSKSVRFSSAFISSVQSSFQSTINICGFVIFFTVLIKLLFISGAIPALAGLIGRVFAPLGMDAEWAERLLTGIIELTSGVWSLQGASGLTATVAMAAFMLGWAGLSVHCQVLSFVVGSGLSSRTFIIGKMIHGPLSAAIIFLLARIIPMESTVASYLTEQVAVLSGMSFLSTLLISLALAAILGIILFAAARYSSKKA